MQTPLSSFLDNQVFLNLLHIWKKKHFKPKYILSPQSLWSFSESFILVIFVKEVEGRSEDGGLFSIQKPGTNSFGLATKDDIIYDGSSRLNVDGMG